jgi:phosphate transport system substrate-binding protein
MMNLKRLQLPFTLAATATIALMLVGCGSDSQKQTEGSPKPSGEGKSVASGEIKIDGSTTVYPILSILAEDFGKKNSGVKVTVNKAGTGSGFQKFAREEIDIATASRPIQEKEIKELEAKKIEFVEIPIAYDGVSVIVNSANTFAADLTVADLAKAWGPDSTVKLWSDINPAFPKEPVTFYGPTDNHGTYEYFTEAVNKKKNAIRKEYQPNQEYTAIVKSIEGDKGGIAFVGFNYYIENKSKVKAVKVGGVEPSEDTIASGKYTPLSRPLFVYINKKALGRPEVKAMVDYLLSDQGKAAVKEASYVQLPAAFAEAVKKHAEAAEVGTKFASYKPGTDPATLYTK